jgi:hypothetical protein
MKKKKEDVKKAAFDIEDRGFRVRAFYLEDDSGDAEIEMTKDGEPFKNFRYPAYRIWNIAAHFSDMVDDLLTPSSK